MTRLLIRPGGIGDFILSLPAMESLRADSTEVWAASQNLPLARFADRTDSIVATGLDSFGIVGPEVQARLAARLRGFDSIVSWYGTGREEFRSAMADLGLPVRFLRAVPEESAGIHAVDFYLAQAAAIPGSKPAAAPRIDCPKGGGGYAVIHPFSGSPKKNWPLERFRELARRLSARMPVHWCAGPEESLEGAVRMDNLYELACWLACARVYIGNDSGITHLAAAAGAPVVALFGPTDPAVWAPRGDSVRVVATSRPGEPMEQISLDDVAAVVIP